MKNNEREIQYVFSLIDRQKFPEALQKCQQLIKDDPKNPECWFAFSRLAFSFNDMIKSDAALEKAIKIAPNNSSYLIQRCLIFVHLGKNNEAMELALTLISKKDLSVSDVSQLAMVFNALEEQSIYLDLCIRAVSLKPDEAILLSNLADAYRFSGQFEQAEKHYEQAISIMPDDFTSHLNLSLLTKWQADNNHINRLTHLLHDDLAWREKMQLNYALGKEYEDLNDADNAFHHYKEGGNLRRQQSNYDVLGDIDTIDKIISSFDQHFCDVIDGYQNDEAIFIVGLPRSGTTLVERIIAAHDDVFAAGELNNFSAELVKLVRSDNGDVSKSTTKLDMVLASAQIDYQTLGENYINSTRPRTGHSKNFIDKLPLNYLYVGNIARALPKSKIICLERHPVDSCFAMFKTLFGQAYPFSYDLDDLAQYYIAYDKLKKHWKKVLGDRVLFVKYEELVNDQEAQSRRILEHCKLPWLDKVMSFYKQKGTVSTASASQVRQPIYKTSVARWKKHEKALQPLIEKLIAAGVKLD